MTHASFSSHSTQGWLGAVLGGFLSAVAFAFALGHAETLAIFLAYLAPLPLFVVGLGAGVAQGLFSCALATVAVGAIGTPSFMLPFIVLFALPVGGLITLAMVRPKARVLGEAAPWLSLGVWLTGLALYPCLLFASAVAVASKRGIDLVEATKDIMQKMTEGSLEGLPPESVAQLPAIFDKIARILPSTIAFCWGFLILIMALAARSFLARQGWLLRKEPLKWNNLSVPGWLLGLVVLAGAGAFFAPAPFDYLGMNIALPLCLPLGIAGLGGLHLWAKGKGSWGTMALVAYYTILTVGPLFGAVGQGGKPASPTEALLFVISAWIAASVPWLVVLTVLWGAIDTAVPFLKTMKKHEH